VNKLTSSPLWVCVIFLLGCPLTPGHPYDERRCTPGCPPLQRCIDGQCRSVDGGIDIATDALGDLAKDTILNDSDIQSLDIPGDGTIIVDALDDSKIVVDILGDSKTVVDVLGDSTAVEQGPVLQVTPNEPFNATADEGGSPYPLKKSYTLTNLSNQSISYGVSAQSGLFFDISTGTTGSISGGGTKYVTVALHASYPFTVGYVSDSIRISSGTETYDRDIGVTVLHAGKTNWASDTANPILSQSLGLAQTWVVSDISNISVAGSQPSIFFLARDNNDARHIGRADGKGTSWAAGTVPVFSGSSTSNAWDESLSCFSVLYDGGTYHLWYQGYSLLSSSNIGYASSADGYAWTRGTTNPVFAPGFSPLGIGWIKQLHVIHDEGLYKMWYLMVTATSETIVGYATSPDRINWMDEGTKILVSSTVQGFSVMREGAVYRMWYALAEEIYYASSSDGLNWTHEPLPVLSTGVSGSFDSNTFDGLDVVRESSSLLRMYYVGNSSAIGQATSVP
jgi:hypothetical protein